MSIRAKITLLVLLVGLSEALALGVIGWTSVASVARAASAQRRIGEAMKGARDLHDDLDGLAVPLGSGPAAAERWNQLASRIERRLSGCAATACHGITKQPPDMVDGVLARFRAFRQQEAAALAAAPPAGGPPVETWQVEVHAAVREITRDTAVMTANLERAAATIEADARRVEGSAGLLVAWAALVCVLVAVAACHPLARSLTLPLERLVRHTVQLARGAAVEAVDERGPLEVATLARAHNAMQAELERGRRELLDHQARLEREVEARVAELSAKDEALRRAGRLASIGLVAGTVAHGLNNPLTSVALNAEALSDDIPASHPARPAMDDLLRDLGRCREIATEMRALARGAEPPRTPCPLDALAREAVRLVRGAAQARGVAVVPLLGGADAVCHAAEARLLEVLANLLTNAIEASPAGARVTLRTARAGGAAVIEVADAGPGIPAGLRDRLFTPLLTTKSDGTGLGLAISKRIVAQHGGHIEVESHTATEVQAGAAASTGTVFRVVLPLAVEAIGGVA